MSEMVDRVAEALMRSRHPKAPLSFAEVVYAVETGSDPSVLEGLRRDARAAIEAMREPTKAMLDAGVDRWDTHHPLATETHPNERATWRAMLDAALCVSDENPKGSDPEGLRSEGLPARCHNVTDAPSLSPKEQKGE